MVTIWSIKKNSLENEQKLMVELRGLSTDTKPTVLKTGEISNGSVFIEIDTQEVYLYDGENETWLPEDEVQPDNEEQENNSRELKEVKEPIVIDEIRDNIEEPIDEILDESR